MSDEPRDPALVSFTSFVDGGMRTVSYDLDLVASAEWEPVDAEYAYLVMRLRDGRVDRIRVAIRTAINVCERVALRD